jgi:tRNA uridine 5-carbamoylmethylation protein Kti12
MEAIRKDESINESINEVVKATLKKKRAGAKPTATVTAAKKAGIKTATIEIISEGASDDSFDLQNIEEIRSLVKEMDASKKQSQASSKDAQGAKFSLTTSLIVGMFLQDQDKNVDWRNPTAKDIDNKRDGSRLLKASSLRKLNQLIEREIGVKSTSNSQGAKYKTIISKSIQNYKMGFGSKLKELHRQCGDDIQQLHSRFEMHLMSKDVGISSFTELDKRFRKPNEPEYKVIS